VNLELNVSAISAGKKLNRVRPERSVL